MKISVCIIEDDLNFSHLLRLILSQTPMLKVVAVADELSQARQRLKTFQEDVYLVDLNLPDGSGIEFIREVCDRYPDAKVLALSSLGDQRHIVSSLQAGASGYILKSELPEDIVETIVKLVNGKTFLSAHASDALVQKIQSDGNQHQVNINHHLTQAELDALSSNSLHDGDVDLNYGNKSRSMLTFKETEVLRHVQTGSPAKQIGTLMDISVFTVNQHLRSIYRKLNVHNKMAAVARANEQGLL